MIPPGEPHSLKLDYTLFTFFGSQFRFQSAIRKYGVPDEEIFQTADLFERRNIAQVTLCLGALGRIVSGLNSKIHFFRSAFAEKMEDIVGKNISWEGGQI